MKSLRILFCITGVVFISAVACAQDALKSHSAGIQLNPYVDGQFFEGTFIKPVFAARYGFNLNNHISFGPELSGFFVKWNSHQGDMEFSKINLGGFIRYSFLSESRIKPFFELSPYYTFYHFKSGSFQNWDKFGRVTRDNYLTGYIGPGITLYSRNRKFSLDLMYKFSDQYFVNGNRSAFTYRLNFNF